MFLTFGVDSECWILSPRISSSWPVKGSTTQLHPHSIKIFISNVLVHVIAEAVNCKFAAWP